MMAANKGPLATRLEPRRLPWLADEATQLKTIDKWAQEDHDKLLLLCDEFGIADGPHRFYKLALALAREHRLGFQERKPVGKWTELTSGYLVVEVERLTKAPNRKPGHTPKWAAQQLAKRLEWRAFLGGNWLDPAEALRGRYHRFKGDRWARIARDAFKYHEYLGTISEWEMKLRDALRHPHPE